MPPREPDLSLSLKGKQAECEFLEGRDRVLVNTESSSLEVAHLA